MQFVGIDVSKKKFDTLWLRQTQPQKVKTRVFQNTRGQEQTVVQWLLKQTGAKPSEIHVVLEATSVYHENLAYALHEAGMQVYVANPARTRDFAKSEGFLSKTDKLDSLGLALYAKEKHERLHLWQPEAPEVRQLRALGARLDALEKDQQREENRLEKAQFNRSSERVIASIKDMIAALKEEIRKLKQDIDDHIDGHPQLQNDRALLDSIKGIGDVMSRELLSLIHSRQFRSAKQCAAFVGLTPMHNESGDSRKPAKIRKGGRSSIRGKLYMAAVTACTHNPDIRALRQRMEAKGKSRMAIVVAAMRKLVQIAYGVIKHQKEYTPQVA